MKKKEKYREMGNTHHFTLLQLGSHFPSRMVYRQKHAFHGQKCSVYIILQLHSLHRC